MSQSNVYSSIEEYLRSKGTKVAEPTNGSKFGSVQEYLANRTPAEIPVAETKEEEPRIRSLGPTETKNVLALPFQFPKEEQDKWPGEPTGKATAIGPRPQRPALSTGHATGIGPAEHQPSWIQRTLEFFGVDEELFNNASETAKAQAVVERMAKERGMSTQEYMVSPNVIEDASIAIGSFLDTASFGLIPALREEFTGETDLKPETFGGYAASALGSLAGLIVSPFKVAGALTKESQLAKWAAKARGGKFLDPTGTYALILKQGLKDAIVLGTGMGLASAGKALQEGTFSDSARVVYDAIKSGALTGAIFGASRGLFPGGGIEGVQRLVAGLIGLNAYRAMETGGNPFTNRPTEEVIFDTLLDVWFLRKGISPAEFRSTISDVQNLNKKVDDFIQKQDLVQSIPDEALKKVAQAKLETEKQQLDQEIEALSKRVYTSVASEAKGSKRLEKLQNIKRQVEEGKLTTAEEIAKAKASRKKAVEEKKVEAKPVEEPKAKTKAKPKEVPPEESLLQTEIPPVMRVEETPKVQEDRSKIDQSEMMVTIKQMEEIENATGKSFDELTDQQIEDYFLGKYSPKKDSLVKEPNDITDEDIEKALGKKIEDMTDEEVDRFLGIPPEETDAKAEPKLEVDVQTGKEEPEVIRGEESIFRFDKETTDGQAAQFAQSKSVANSVDELFNQQMTDARKDPSATVWKLVNDVNRWLNGDEVDIDHTRDFLSEVASRSDEFNRYFESNQAHEAWKELVGDAAKWARDASKGRKKRSTLTSLHFGLPLDEAGSIVKGWYSALRRYAEDKLPNSAVGQQILNTLRKGSTKDEWEAVGLSELLDPGRKYSKDEVLKLIDEGTVEFKDVLLKESTRSIDDFIRAHREVVEEQGKYLPIGSTPHDRMALFQIQEKILSKYEISQDEWNYFTKTGLTKDTGTKYGSYVEPGGTNYKELFVTAPQPIDKLIGISRSLLDSYEARTGKNPFGEIDPESGLEVLSKDFLSSGEGIEYSRHYRARVEEQRYWKDGHSDYSDIENPIVRLRMNDRIDADGKKVLFLEEIQPPIPSEQAKMPEALRKRWREIGMKRAIKYAIDGGYDKLAWTTGEMQTKRYPGVAQRVEEIVYSIRNDGTYKIEALPRGLNNTVEIGTFLPGELDRVVGKELANRIRAKEGYKENQGFGNITDLNVDIGGQGLRKLYNQDLPNVAKKLGGEVEEININVEKSANAYAVKLYPDGKYYVYDRLTYDQVAGPFDSAGTADIARHDMIKGVEGTTVPSISISPIKQKVSQSQGFPLYMGFDPDMFKRVFRSRKKLEEDKSTSGDEIVDQAKGFRNYTEKARGLKEFKPKVAAERMREGWTTATLDKSGNFRRWVLKYFGQDGYEALQKAVLSRGASSISTKVLQQMRKEVYDGLNRKEKQVLDNLILANRMVDIGKYKKHYRFPKEINPTASRIYNALFPYIEGLTPEQANKLVEFDAEGNLSGGRVKAYYDWMKKPLKDLLDSGLITEQEYTDLASHNYRRIELISDAYDKKHPDIKVRGRSVYDSGVEALSLGKQTDIYEPSSEIMALEVFNRSYGRILNNEANKALLDLARKNPENPFVRFKEGKDSDVKIPTGWKRFYTYEGGERKTMHLSPEFAREWISNSSETSYRMSNLIRTLSGAPILRTFATGINWGFALANLPRDILHIWYASRVWEDGKWKSLYNPNLPVYGAQMGSDLIGVAKDAFLRKGKWIDYIMEGGGFEFLTHQGRLLQRGRHIGSGMDKFFDVMGYFGETSEILTRLAVRDRVIKRRAKELGISYEEASKNKKITREATFAARDYMDFGQGGWAIKTLDQAVPYLNPSVQGTRGLFRAFKPGSGSAMSSMYKLSQFAALVVGMTIAKHKMRPNATQALQGNIDEENNLVIPLGDDPIQLSDGQQGYKYWKVPLDPSQKFFKVFFEAATDKWYGRPIDVDRVVGALKQFSPVSDVSGILPPTVSAFIGYVTNKDFWLNSDIWTKTDKPFGWTTVDKQGKWIGSSAESIPGRTPEVYKDIGDVTRLSPERLRYAVEELVTSGTEISYILGQGYDRIFGELPKSDRDKLMAEVLSRVPGAKRFIGVTNPYSQFAKPISDIQTQSELERWIRQSKFDTVVESYLFDKTSTYSDVVKEARSHKDPEIFKNLMDDFQFTKATKNLPNRAFWLSIKRLPLEGRAQAFVNRLDAATDAQRSALFKEMSKVSAAGGIITKDFLKEVARLRASR